MITPDPASFRDPDGFVFHKDNKLYRSISPAYKAHYRQLMDSGLYDELRQKDWIVAHQETSETTDESWLVIQPEVIQRVTYPHEWSFSQLKDAALLTLQVQQTAMRYGMTLKDATGFNILFEGGKPMFIDTLSFEWYDEHQPWVAYRQFCECFLTPLLLAAYRKPELISMLSLYPYGIPISLCRALLPLRSLTNSLALLNIHLQHAVRKPGIVSSQRFHKNMLIRILDHLERGIRKLKIKGQLSTWNHYYQDGLVSTDYLDNKLQAIESIIENIPFQSVLDLGANEGVFSIAFAKSGKSVLATDFDHDCIERLYLRSKKEKLPITVMVTDLMNPSPALGWANEERKPFFDRCSADLVIALALIHHLCISKNLPMSRLMKSLANVSTFLLIEFVPKQDPKVQQLLAHRKDIFEKYTEEEFRKAFIPYFNCVRELRVPNTERTLFLLHNLKAQDSAQTG